MIGLLSKDLTIMKKQFKLAIIILIGYAAWGFFEHSTTMFAYMSVLFGVFIPITAITFDERAQWMKYALCMPVKKSYIAISKYILGFFGIAVGVIGFYILTFLVDSQISLEQVKIGLSLLSIGMILISFYLPACFKLGAERARYVIIAIGMLICAIILGLSKTGILEKIDHNSINALLNMAPVLAFAIVIISGMISIHIISTKEY